MTRARRLAAAAIAIAAVTTIAGALQPAPAAVTYDTYFAGMHNHTGYSDGVPETTPADAYTTAKANGLDIMTTSEHSESFPIPNTFSEQCLPNQGGTLVECALADGTNSFRKWDANLEQAHDATTSDFLAARGFEWTSDVEDHINVYLSSQYTNAKMDGGYATMATFWKWVADNKDALVTFNHPGDKTNVNTGGAKIAPGPYDDFRYIPDADNRVVGIEVFNDAKSKNKDYTNRNSVNWIARALNTGWHVGLVGSQDTHTDDWGDPTKYARTGFLMPALTEQDFQDALLARRFYATTDSNLALQFTADGEQMGSRLRRPVGAQVTLDVSATDPDGEQVTSIKVFTNGGTRDTWSEFATSAGPTLQTTVTSEYGERWYLAQITQADGEKAYTSPIWIGANTHPYGEWMSGDLHVHTQNGHDTCMGDNPTKKYDGTDCPIDEIYTWSFSPGERIELAKERGLDYLAITDHNNVTSQSDGEYKAEQAAEAAGTSNFVLVPAYENSLPGHAQMLGATACFGGTRMENGVELCTNPDESVAGIQAYIQTLHDGGGAFQVNHPSDQKWIGRYDGKDTNGNQINDLFEMVPDSIEIWNIGPWVWQQPAFSANDNDFSLEFWERFLSAGYHVTATGGSDSHWRATSAGQGVGQPTTWVYSAGRTWQDVTAGIRSGGTTISYNPPAYAGARLFLEADADGNGSFESMPGDTIPKGKHLRLRAENVPPGAMIRVVDNDPSQCAYRSCDRLYALDELNRVTFTSNGSWVRAELVMSDGEDLREQNCDPSFGSDTTWCRNRLAVLALTSVIYQS